MILKNYDWCQVIQRDDKFFIRYDAGGVVVKMVEHEISKEDAQQAQIDQNNAEQVVRSIQRKS